MEILPVQRMIQRSISTALFKGKAIILLGARQVGKSTLLQNLIKDFNAPALWLDAEEADVPPLFAQPTKARMAALAGKNKVVVIDEAQKIPNIGSVLKIFTDHVEDVQIIATDSSAFDLRNITDEPLTGRKWLYHLYPFSFAELVDASSLLEEKRQLHQRLIYGSYPEVVLAEDAVERRLRHLSESYLYKDILLWSGLKKPERIVDLLRALSYQVSHEVNYHELGGKLGLKGETVESYIQIMERAYVIFRLPSLSRNARKELRKGKKVYFFDNGIRNALINNFSPVETRQDIGALWENYIVSDVWKKEQYTHAPADFFFWRTADQQEVDLVLEKNGRFRALEIKWNPNARARLSQTFRNAYPETDFSVVTPATYDELLLG